MRRQIRLWGTRAFALVVLAGAVQYGGVPLYKQYFTKKKTEAFVPTAKVESGKFIISFHEIGNLKARNSISISTATGGKIIKLVPEGTMARAGDTLVVMDTTDLERELRSKQLTFANAQADVQREETKKKTLEESNATELGQAEAELAYNQKELERARAELEKQKRLAKEKLVPGYRVDEAELKVSSAELAVKKGEMALDLKRKKATLDLKQQEAEIATKGNAEKIARIDMEDVESRIGRAVLTAPSGGLVVLAKTWTGDGHRKFKEGDSVWPGRTICELPDLGSMQVVVQVGESDAPRVRVGMRVLIRLEAVRNKVFHGTVEDISSLATEADPFESNATPGRKNFEVTIAVKEVDARTLKPGMTADAEFLIDTLEKSHYVPIEAVNERNGKTFVFVKRGGRYARTYVETGKSNDNFICITRGLHEGDAVALRDPTLSLDVQEAGSAAPGTGKDAKAVPVPRAD